MTQKIVLGFFIIALLVCSSCGKKSSDPNEIEKMKAENAALKAKIQQLGGANANQLNPSITTNPNKKTVADVNEVVKKSKPIFGIYLGEKLDELKKRFELISGKPERDDDPSQAWFIRTDNPSIEPILIRSFEQYVWHIFISFKDASERNFNALKAQLEQTYGKEDDGGINGIVFAGKRAFFFPKIDNIQIAIGIEYKKGFGEPDRLTIMYDHGPILLKVEGEIKRRKLAKVKDDL